MTRRLKILLVFVAILVVVNFALYLQKDNAADNVEVEVIARAITAEDFTILSASRFAQSKSASRRDLFVVAIKRKKPKIVIKVKPKPALKIPPAKTPEQIAREGAEAELLNAHLVGVIKRGTQFQAYIEWNGETYLTRKGQIIYGEFKTKLLSVDHIVIEHASTGVVKKILISGE